MKLSKDYKLGCISTMGKLWYRYYMNCTRIHVEYSIHHGTQIIPTCLAEIQKYNAIPAYILLHRQYEHKSTQEDNE